MDTSHKPHPSQNNNFLVPNDTQTPNHTGHGHWAYHQQYTTGSVHGFGSNADNNVFYTTNQVQRDDSAFLELPDVHLPPYPYELRSYSSYYASSHCSRED